MKIKTPARARNPPARASIGFGEQKAGIPTPRVDRFAKCFFTMINVRLLSRLGEHKAGILTPGETLRSNNPRGVLGLPN